MHTNQSGRERRPPRWSTLLWRGIRLRCPRCARGGVMASWFRLRDRCPHCGYRFVREDGFWLGAYVVNFGLVDAVIAAVLFAYIIAAANNPDLNTTPLIIGSVAAAVLVPLLFFPFSRTVWAAIDLAMRPLEPAEEAEAATWLESVSPPASEPR